MKDYIEERAVEIAYYIIEHKATVRQTAKIFGVSKSTVHKDVTERLLKINPALAGEARKVLNVNKQERHNRHFIKEVPVSDAYSTSEFSKLRRFFIGSESVRYCLVLRRRLFELIFFNVAGSSSKNSSPLYGVRTMEISTISSRKRF